MVVTHGSGLCCATCRLKNNFRSAQNRPPDILINVVVEGDGFAPLVGEIQIHLRSVLILKEMEHFHYEACAALHGVGVRYLWLRAPFSCAASAYCFRLTAPLDALLAHLRAQVRRAPTALALLAEARDCERADASRFKGRGRGFNDDRTDHCNDRNTRRCRGRGFCG